MYKKRISMGRRGLCAMIIGIGMLGACSPSQAGNEERYDSVVPDEGVDFGYVQEKSVICEGVYPQHLQGISTDDQGNIFWSFTTELVKTDKDGKVLHTIEVDFHHGDLYVVEGKVFVAVGFGKWNNIDGLADSWVYVYSADDLRELQRIQVPEVVYGAGGIVHKDKKFYVVGGLPETVDENYIYEYDENFSFIAKHILQTGHTDLGIQSIDYHNGQWWLGVYGSPKLFILEEDFSVTAKYQIDTSLGIASLSKDLVLVGSNEKQSDGGFIGKATTFRKSK